MKYVFGTFKKKIKSMFKKIAFIAIAMTTNLLAMESDQFHSGDENSPTLSYCSDLILKMNTVFHHLKNENLISQSACIKNILKPDWSASAEAVIFIEDSTGAVVAKVFRKPQDFHKEYAGYTAGLWLEQLMHDLRCKCTHPIPIIVKLKAACMLQGDVGVFLLDEAQGKTLYYYIEQIPNTSEEEIKAVFSNIGEQFGSLDSLMLEKKKGILKHSDSFGANIVYDKANHIVYWIDTAGEGGLKFAQEENGLGYLIFLREIISLFIRMDINTTDEILNLVKALQALQAFSQAYYNRNSLDCVKVYHNNFKYKDEDSDEMQGFFHSLNISKNEIDFITNFDLEHDWKIQ